MANNPSRRDLIRLAAAGVATAAMAATMEVIEPWARAAEESDRRLNFVILVGEDMSPDIGCYGAPSARTPNLDRLASQGARFNQCFTHCPVCAPSRSGMITGQYPTAIGTHHMRSTLLRPPPMFTRYLQEAGYKIVWTNKTDFNFEVPRRAFDSKADWTELGEGLPHGPFLAFFNIFTTHESQVRGTPEMHRNNTVRLQPADRQDADKVPLPPFYPDTSEIRHDLKQYYELCTAVDYKVGDVMAMLERTGRADNTVVIFTGDHGRGIPRMKRWCYHGGTHIPLIVRWPGGIKPGTVSDQLVAMVDLPATILSLAGVSIPKEFAGAPFVGADAKPRNYVYAHRDRMDETLDRIRSVRDSRYQYVLNFHPELPYAQYIDYNELNPIMKSWRAMGKAGKLTPDERRFFAATKPREEFYDNQTDPHSMKNLIASTDPAIQAKIAELRTALNQWIDQTHDLGAIPETELIRRGLVADRLTNEYNLRLRDHPKEPPYLPNVQG